MNALDLPDQVSTRRDHGCFGCGSENPCGLRLVFARDGDAGVVATYTPRRQDEGFFGIVHGGIVTAMLDEAMAWATYAAESWAMTAKIEVRFRQPVRVGADLTVHGRIVSTRGKLLETAGEIRDAEARVLAEATATFIRVSEGQAREWEARYFG